MGANRIGMHYTIDDDGLHGVEDAARYILSRAGGTGPIPMILHCPACGLQHIDAPDERAPEWENPPHRSHLCHRCGHIWRPADVPTEGVAAIQTRGKNDSPLAGGTGSGEVDRKALVELISEALEVEFDAGRAVSISRLAERAAERLMLDPVVHDLNALAASPSPPAPAAEDMSVEPSQQFADPGKMVGSHASYTTPPPAAGWTEEQVERAVEVFAAALDANAALEPAIERGKAAMLAAMESLGFGALRRACVALVEAEDKLLADLRAEGRHPDLTERPWSLMNDLRAALSTLAPPPSGRE